jgi:hypothetical protein
MSFAPVRRCSARDRPPRSFSAPVLSDDDGQAASSPSPRKSAPGGTGDDRDHGYPSDESPPPSPPTVVDLTVPGAARMRVPGARHPRAFTPATRRVYARRERAYDRAVPGVVLERIDTMSEEPAGTANPDERYGRVQQQDPARARALAHLATAYAITAYTHAALNIALTAVAAWAAVAFARALAGDISRKTPAIWFATTARAWLTARTHRPWSSCAISGRRASSAETMRAPMPCLAPFGQRLWPRP